MSEFEKESEFAREAKRQQEWARESAEKFADMMASRFQEHKAAVPKEKLSRLEGVLREIEDLILNEQWDTELIDEALEIVQELSQESA